MVGPAREGPKPTVSAEQSFDPGEGLERLVEPGLLQDRVASGREVILTGTEKARFVRGLDQISWLPLPCRLGSHPASRNSRAKRR
jgi:hypothetical protein